MLYRLINNRNFPIMLLGDAGLVLLSYFTAYWIRFDGVIPPSYLTSFFHSFFWIVPLKLGAFLFFDLYKGMWRYTSIHDMLNIVKATVGSSVGVILVVLLAYRFHGFSRGIFVIDLGLTFLLISGFRVCIRLFFTEIDKRRGFAHIRRKGLRSKKIIIVGAGSTGEKLYREIQDNRSCATTWSDSWMTTPRNTGRPSMACPCSAIRGTFRELLPSTRWMKSLSPCRRPQRPR